jgi:hypothetical protein
MTIKKQPIELDDDVLKDLDLSHHGLTAKPGVEKTVYAATAAGAKEEPVGLLPVLWTAG